MTSATWAATFQSKTLKTSSVQRENSSQSLAGTPRSAQMIGMGYSRAISVTTSQCRRRPDLRFTGGDAGDGADDVGRDHHGEDGEEYGAETDSGDGSPTSPLVGVPDPGECDEPCAQRDGRCDQRCPPADNRPQYETNDC